MSINASPSFGERLSRIEKKHRKLRRGAVTVMRPDGLMVLQPKSSSMPRVIAFAMLLFIAVIGFKAMVFVADGPISYQTRLDRLASGTPPEAMAAQIMAIDPVTQAVLDHGQPLFHRAMQEWSEFRPKLIAENWGLR